MSQLPSVSFSTNAGLSSGRNQDPTNFSLITTSYLSSGYSLQIGMDIFNWFSKRNNIAGNELDLQAANAAVDKLRNDIALNVANAYLNILLTKEQANIAAVQLQQSQAQLTNTRKLVNAGSLPELNASELEAQVARDSANFIQAQTNTVQNTILLKALMNLDPAQPFEVEAPPVEQIPVENIGDLQPDAVYALALTNQPLQKVNKLKIEASKKYVLASRAAMYPTFSLYGNLGTTYNNQAREVTGVSPVNAPLGKVSVSGTDYDVFPLQPFNNFTYGNIGYTNQLNQNFRQSVGINLSVPILQGWNLRTQYNRSKLNVESLTLQQDLDNYTLKQNIYQAYTQATAALQKFEANKKVQQTAQRSFDFAQKRYDIGLLNSIDLVTSQNNLYRAKLDVVYAQFDYVFKMKVLEFYKGQGIRLK
ncbi:MAG: TolC family protein [Gemmatimonadaceae bacterium]|nr:TolC family protein [Chitinophagaceae bacterium]